MEENKIKERKTALITGSYGGLGTCFVNIHASKGGDLILVGRSQSKLDGQKKEVEKKFKVNVETIAADLSNSEEVVRIYEVCKENGWEVDYLINNAGGLSDTKLFANAVSPDQVAKDGYDGMLDGALNITSGLPGWQKPMMTFAPMFPKKTMLDFVYNQQIAGSNKKK